MKFFIIVILSILFLNLVFSESYDATIEITSQSPFYTNQSSYPESYQSSIEITSESPFYVNESSYSESYSSNIDITQETPFYVNVSESNKTYSIRYISSSFGALFEVPEKIKLNYGETYTNSTLVFSPYDFYYRIYANSTSVSFDVEKIHKSGYVTYTVDSTKLGIGNFTIRFYVSLINFTEDWLINTHKKRTGFIIWIDNPTTGDIFLNFSLEKEFSEGMREDCKDIVITIFNNTTEVEVPVQITKCDSTTGVVELFIRNNVLADNEIPIYLYYYNTTPFSRIEFSHGGYQEGFIFPLDSVTTCDDMEVEVTGYIPPPFNFSVNVVEDRVTLSPNECKDIHIQVRTIEGTPQTVTLYAYDLPENVSITFDPQAGIPDFDSIGTLCAGDVIPYGTYIVTISGVSGNISANDTFELELTTIVFDFSIDVSPVNLTLVQNTTGNYNVYVNLVEGTPQEVTLSLQNYPSGLTYSFSPDKVVPSGQSTLTVTANVPLGYYEMYVVGTWNGITRSKKIGLNVVERIPLNFNVRIVPDKQILYKPGSTQYTIYIDYISGTREPVSLSIAGLPSGVTYSFEPTSVVPSGTSLLTIEASGEAQDGNYTFTVCGSSSESTVCDSAELEIRTLVIPLQFLFEDPYIILAIIIGVIAGYIGKYSTAISFGIFSIVFVIYAFYNPDVLALLIIFIAFVIVYTLNKLIFR